MTELLLGVAVVGLMVLGVVAIVRSRPDRSGSGPVGLHASWMGDAQAVAARGRRLGDALASAVERDRLDRSDEAGREFLRQLDDLTQDLTRLTTAAPSPMDERLCRAAAVRSRALRDTLGSWVAADTSAGGGPAWRSGGGQEVLDRLAEFVLAVTDLDQHIRLI